MTFSPSPVSSAMEMTRSRHFKMHWYVTFLSESNSVVIDWWKAALSVPEYTENAES